MPQAAPTAADIAAQAENERRENADALNLDTEDRLPPSRTTTRPQADQNLSDDDYDRQSEHVVINRSPADDARSNIVNRFRHAEVEEERPFSGDLSSPENLYGEFGQEPGDEPEDISSIVGERPREEPETLTPAKRKLTVRGQTLELTDDEILAAAQKTLAGDSYLDEARTLLNEAKKIKATRTASDNQHPDGQEDAQSLEFDDPDAQDDAQHPEPSFRNVIEKIQYGDPDEAAAELERLVDTRATKRVTEDHAKRLFDNDLARSQKTLKSFIAANPALANDEIAALAIERGMYNLYKEDIVKLGMPEDKIPSDPTTLANWHRWYRVHGHEVRNTGDLLEASKKKFETWRGGQPSNQQRQQPRPPAPRVQVNVDRDTRRAAIPLQPTRTVTPRRETQPAAPVSRSDVVATMRRQRGQA